MTYDFAKELKEGGWPRTIYFYDETKEIGNEPTLEELIEMCPKNYKEGEHFNGDFTLKVYGDGSWHVGYEHMDGWYEGAEGEGSTPTEAVGRLWIALNKKTV